jgi:monoamine oxidase
MLLFVQTVLAADPRQPSFLFLLKYIRAAGGLRALGDGDGGAQQWRLAGGAQQMAAGLAAAVAGAGGGEVRLSHIVESVAHSAYNSAAAQNHIECGSDEPGVYTVAGTVEGSGKPFSLTARRVVVAMPPPVWKQVAFDPQLPEDHRLLAESMVMGCVAKVLAIYPQRFWALEGEEADSSTGGGAGGADDEVVRDAPRRPPRRARGGAGGRRLEECGPVANLFPGDYGGRPALVGLVTGADARAFTALPEGRQRAAVLGQYAEYFGAPEAAEPELVVVKEWMSERFSGGCFGGLTPPGLLSRAGAAAAGRAAGGVHFAGSEAAARWVGYFEGALDAGLRAALEVLAALRPGLVGSAATSGGDGEGPAAAL